MDEREDETPIPCPACLQVYECSPTCEQDLEDWMRENGDL